MQIPAQRWLDAIFKRHSRRQYTGEALASQAVNHLSLFTEELNQHLAGARIVLLQENPETVFKGLIGGYGKIKDAPAYAAFLGNMADPHIQEKAGYLGECFVLEATALGLATCWVGGFFKPETVAKHTNIAEGESVLAVTPLGYAPANKNFLEKTMSSLAKSRDRKPLQELCEQGTDPDWPQWVKKALEAARLAPSAVNRQPWRFVVEEQGITVKVDNDKNNQKISKRLDCGIVMLHLEVGALACGVQGQWQYLQSPEVAVFKIG